MGRWRRPIARGITWGVLGTMTHALVIRDLAKGDIWIGMMVLCIAILLLTGDER